MDNYKPLPIGSKFVICPSCGNNPVEWECEEKNQVFYTCPKCDSHFSTFVDAQYKSKGMWDLIRQIKKLRIQEDKEQSVDQIPDPFPDDTDPADWWKH